MLRLYHYWSSVCSQKVRMCLAEKSLDWESRHVDIFAFENYEPAYTRLNPKAVVPTLDYDGVYNKPGGFWSADQFIEAVYKSLSAKK